MEVPPNHSFEYLLIRWFIDNHAFEIILVIFRAHVFSATFADFFFGIQIQRCPNLVSLNFFSQHTRTSTKKKHKMLDFFQGAKQFERMSLVRNGRCCRYDFSLCRVPHFSPQIQRCPEWLFSNTYAKKGYKQTMECYKGFVAILRR